MKKKGFILVLCSVFIWISVMVFKHVTSNKEKLIYAVHSMPKFERDDLERTIKLFNKENPSVTVELREFKRSYSDLRDGIKSSEEPIDVLLLPYPLLPVFARTDLIIPMTKYNGIKKLKNDPSWEAFGYPRKSSPYALLFNKEFIKYSKKKMPKTQEEFQSILQELADNGVSHPFIIDTYLWEYLNDPYINEFVLKTVPEKEVNFWNDLLKKNLMVRTRHLEEENRYDSFLNRKTAFIIATVEGITHIEKEDPSLNFGAISIPEDNGNFEQLLIYNRYAIGKNSKNPDLAFKFIEFLNYQN